uniref:Uncharacterized protein n=1 Tax=Rhizophora mucronata TaxID=61149 RepID=A0A2P2Q711_RHIMU
MEKDHGECCLRFCKFKVHANTTLGSQPKWKKLLEFFFFFTTPVPQFTNLSGLKS